MGPELVVRHGCGPELVVGSCVHGVRAAWLCIGPGLVLRVGRIVDGDRSGCAWCQGWLNMGSGPVCETMQACMDIRTFHFLKCQCLLYKTVRAQL